MTGPHILLKREHYTPTELGKLIGVSRQTIVKWITAGRLQGTRTQGGHWRVPASVVRGLEPVQRVGQE